MGTPLLDPLVAARAGPVDTTRRDAYTRPNQMVTPILKHRSPAEWAGQPAALARRSWLALSLIALACGEPVTPEPPEPAAVARVEQPSEPPRILTPLLVGNHLRNPGFEANDMGWGEIEDSKQVDFEVVEEPTHSGRAAARLVASWRPGDRERPVSLRSATQDISPPLFPDRITGWYRVDRWEDTPDPGALQLQIIVVVFGDPRTLEIVRSDDPNDPEVDPRLDNFQLRYQLAGPTEEPEDSANVRYRVIGKGPPELGNWVRFELRVKSDFEQRWNHIPANFRQLRVMFGIRWDDKQEGAALHADVYYDDLFFGFDDL